MLILGTLGLRKQKERTARGMNLSISGFRSMNTSSDRFGQTEE